jgi:hypothetical protein
MLLIETVHLDLSVFRHHRKTISYFGGFLSFAFAAGGQSIFVFFGTIDLG